MSDATRAKRAPARSGAAGNARRKFDDLPGMISHFLVAEKLGITPENIRDWVAKGSFPRPHSVFERTWLYRVDFVRAFLETGKWPDGAEFSRPATRREDGE